MPYQLVIYDFDGVMTDNRAFVFQDGTEAVLVNRSDGVGVNGIRELGIAQVIVSTEVNPVVGVRGRKLRLEVFQGVADKAAAVRRLLDERGVPREQAIYVGNDVNDLGAMAEVGMPVCPADAYPEVLRVARRVLVARGGGGVVRELFGLLRDGLI